MPRIIGNVELHMGPQQVGGPDDLKRAIVDFIDGAKRKLFIAVQELDSADITRAIIRARQRKVLVKLVLEGDYLTVKKAVVDPFTQTGQNEANRQLHDAVLRAKIDVKSDFNSKIFHQKFIVRDGSAVLTGSTNFTDTGISKNLNHVVIIRDRKVANTYTEEFKEIQQGHFGALNEGHDERPRNVTVSDIPIRILFAPDHAPEMEIMKQMAKTKTRVDFAIFTFAQSSGIDDVMIQLTQGSGKRVRGLLDGRAANQTWAATRPVKNAGAQLFVTKSKPGHPLGKLHHKLMVIDEQLIIAGSFNYTGPANRLNDENIIILGDLESRGESKQGQKRLARYALDEINRIQATFGHAV